MLELGCAHGVNLAPMAFHLPDGRFVGVDLSESQIARGRARYASLGMANFELVAVNVQSLDLRGEQFDYIVAHRLYSWVPSEVRDSILRVIRDHLAPNGIAYVSFNAMPAWGVRGAVRAALVELVSLDLEPRARVAAARRALEALGQVDALPGTAEGALLQEEFRALKAKPDAYLLHEYLSPHCEAFYLRQVVADASRHALGWVTDVADSGLDRDSAEALRRSVDAMVSSTVAREQIADVLTFRQFRASLFAHAASRRDAELALEEAYFVANDAPRDDDEAVLFDALAHPAGTHFGAALERTGHAPDALRDRLADLVESTRVTVRPRRLPIEAPSASPRVAALTRLEASHQSFVTNPKHEYAPTDAFHAALLTRLDGSTRATVVAGLIEDLDAGRFVLRAPPGVDPAAVLHELIDRAVPTLARAGLLVTDAVR